MEVVLVFFDDILIYNSSWAEHLQHINIVLNALWAHHLHLKALQVLIWGDIGGLSRPCDL